MKTNIFLVLTVLFICRCKNVEQKQSKMKQKATIVEVVLFKTNEGVNLETAKKAMLELNNFVSKQNGFISRKTSISDDSEFIDIVYWTDLESAKAASEKALNNNKTMEVFKMMNQKEMIFKYFSVFNEFEKKVNK